MRMPSSFTSLLLAIMQPSLFDKIAIGLAGYSAEDSNAIKGHKSDEIAKILSYSHREEMIHKDDLVLIWT